jgi:hypothetical protein
MSQMAGLPHRQTRIHLEPPVAVAVEMDVVVVMVELVTTTVAVVEAKQMLVCLDLLVQVLLCFLIMLLRH